MQARLIEAYRNCKKCPRALTQVIGNKQTASHDADKLLIFRLGERKEFRSRLREGRPSRFSYVQTA